MCPILGFECCLRSTLAGAVHSASGHLHILPGSGGHWSWVLKDGDEVWGKAVLGRGISIYESTHWNGLCGWNIKTLVGDENGDTADGQAVKSTVDRLRSFGSILECGPILAAGITPGGKLGPVGCGRNICTFSYLASSRPFIFSLV